MGITLRLMVDTIRFNYQFNYCFIIYRLCFELLQSDDFLRSCIVFIITLNLTQEWRAQFRLYLHYLDAYQKHSNVITQVDCHLYKEQGLPWRSEASPVKSYGIVILGLSRCIDPPSECSTPATSKRTPLLNSIRQPQYRASLLSSSLEVSSLNLVVIESVGDEIGPKAAGGRQVRGGYLPLCVC